MTGLKKVWALLAAAALAFSGMAAPARAADSGYYYNFGEAGIRLQVDTNWLDAAQNQQIVAWLYHDKLGADMQVAWMLLPDISVITSNEAAEIEAALNEHAILLCGVAVAKEGAPAGAGVPQGAQSQQIDARDGYTFTFFRAGNEVPEEFKAIADAMLATMENPAHQITTSRPGALGLQFETTLLDGTAVTEETLRAAKYTVLNIWATYCGVCVQEMPLLQTLSAEYADKGIQFLGLVSDVYPGDDTSAAQAIAAKTGVTYANMVASDSLGALLSTIQYVPTTIVLDEFGRAVGEPIVGGQSEQTWRELLDSLPLQ